MSKELEDRFGAFAKRVRDLCRRLKWDVINCEYIKQLIKASGSVAANYIEASDDLGKADEKMKIKLSRREAKESKLWLGLIMIMMTRCLKKKGYFCLMKPNKLKKSCLLLSTNRNK